MAHPTPCSRGRRASSFPGGDADTLTTRLVALLTDPDLRRRLGERGRAWVSEEWRWDTAAGRLAGLLDPGQPLPEGDG